MTTGRQSFTRGFDTDQLDGVIADERVKDAHRIGPASYTCDYCCRQLLLRFQNLLSRLGADDRLEIAHHARVRVWPDYGTDDVVRISHARDPIAHRLVGRILEGAASRSDLSHLSTEQIHPIHIQRLSARILFAHVNDAFKAKKGANSCGRDTVLSCACFGDDTALAHAQGEQYLTERVIDLVRTCVIQILSLEIDPGATRWLSRCAL